MKIYLWQRDADRDAPEQMGRYYASAIPSCDATLYPGEGYMIFFSHAEEILKTIDLVGDYLKPLGKRSPGQAGCIHSTREPKGW